MPDHLDEAFGSSSRSSALPGPIHSCKDSLASSTFEPFVSTPINHKVKPDSTSRTPSSTNKSKAVPKCGLKELFTEGSVKDNKMLKRLGLQKHERAIGEQELKRRKLEHKTMEKQHQRERECKQHQYCMLQMQMMLSQNQRGMPAMAQATNKSLYEGLGLLAELNDVTITSGNSYSI